MDSRQQKGMEIAKMKTIKPPTLTAALNPFLYRRMRGKQVHHPAGHRVNDVKRGYRVVRVGGRDRILAELLQCRSQPFRVARYLRSGRIRQKLPLSGYRQPHQLG